MISFKSVLKYLIYFFLAGNLAFQAGDLVFKDAYFILEGVHGLLAAGGGFNRLGDRKSVV